MSKSPTKRTTKKSKKQPPKRSKTECEIMEVFNQFDVDGSGYVDIHELREMLFFLGQLPTEKDVKNIMKEVDEDKNGVIDIGEFMSLMKNCLKDEQECHDELYESFTIFDRNGDGEIDKKELTWVLQNTGEKLSKSTINYVFDRMDVDGSGTIKFDEFCQAMGDGIWNTPIKKESKADLEHCDTQKSKAEENKNSNNI